MAFTDQQLYNELQYHLLETPNNGASYGSSLYTVDEVVGRTNFRLDLFNTLTNSNALFHQIMDATSGVKAQDLSVAVPNLIDVIAIFYSSDAGTTYYSIPNGSSEEADDYIASQSALTLPVLWAADTAKTQQLNFFPAPTFTGTNGKISVTGVNKIGFMPAVPNGTPIVGVPDDFVPFIKYGVLADLFGKSGETYDPVRAQICESLFQLGVELTRSWISGTDMQ